MAYELPYPATWHIVVVLAATAISASTASAQSVNDNVQRDAENAFGTSVGGDSIGIYNSSEVRGFSPTDAGNIRLEGLTIDRPAEFTSRLVRSSAILVGIGAVGEPFPAPSGIVDYRLFQIGEGVRTNLGGQVDSFGARFVQVDGQASATPSLGISAGAGAYWNETSSGSDEVVSVVSLSPEWRPASGLRIRPFWALISKAGAEPEAIFRVDGDRLPKIPPVDQLLAPEWAKGTSSSMNSGLIANWEWGSLDVDAGAFRSVREVERGYSYIIGFDGAVFESARIVASDRHSFTATSGELRFTYQFDGGDLHHQIIGSVRGRAQDRTYGRIDTVDGPTPALDFSIQPFPEPELFFAEPSTDRIEQAIVGATWRILWQDRIEAKFGIQNAWFGQATQRLNSDFSQDRDSAILLNAALAARVFERWSVYAGYTEGLEEGAFAPDIAINRGEALGAILTNQREAGVRYRISGSLDVQVGYFDIRKPYDELDLEQRFRRIGQLRHHGIEFSATATPFSRLSILAGGVFLNAEVSGELVEGGIIGSSAVGASDVVLLGSIDYRLPWVDGLSVDAGVEYSSSVAANTTNSFDLPSQFTFDLGVRYRFKLSGFPMLIRLQAQNLTNEREWQLVSSGAIRPNQPRRIVLSIAADL